MKPADLSSSENANPELYGSERGFLKLANQCFLALLSILNKTSFVTKNSQCQSLL